MLENRGLFTEDWWRWLGVGVLIAYAVVLNIAVLLAQTFLNREPPACQLFILLLWDCSVSASHVIMRCCWRVGAAAELSLHGAILMCSLPFVWQCQPSVQLPVHCACHSTHTCQESSCLCRQCLPLLAHHVTACTCVAAVGNAPAAVPEEALREREINRTGSGFAGAATNGASPKGAGARSGKGQALANGGLPGAPPSNGKLQAPANGHAELHANGSADLGDIELGTQVRRPASCHRPVRATLRPCSGSCADDHQCNCVKASHRSRHLYPLPGTGCTCVLRRTAGPVSAGWAGQQRAGAEGQRLQQGHDPALPAHGAHLPQHLLLRAHAPRALFPLFVSHISTHAPPTDAPSSSVTYPCSLHQSAWPGSLPDQVRQVPSVPIYA